jgi:hypothetical protein
MLNRLKSTLLISGLVVAMGGASAVSAAMVTEDAVANDHAAPAVMDNGVSYAGQAGQLEQAQFFYSGRNYCWYAGGWRGPGYYWCGYAWRRGYGWGGPFGWNGWGRPGWHGGGVWRGGPGWRGGPVRGGPVRGPWRGGPVRGGPVWHGGHHR